MSRTLEIKHYSDIEIVKVKKYAIHFDCNGERYFIHEGEENTVNLYRRPRDPSGKYEFLPPEHISTKNGDYCGFILAKHGLTYTELNRRGKERFIGMLVKYGFSTGLKEKEYKEYCEANKRIEAAIQEMRNMQKIMQERYFG